MNNWKKSQKFKAISATQQYPYYCNWLKKEKPKQKLSNKTAKKAT